MGGAVRRWAGGGGGVTSLTARGLAVLEQPAAELASVTAAAVNSQSRRLRSSIPPSLRPRPSIALFLRPCTPPSVRSLAYRDWSRFAG